MKKNDRADLKKSLDLAIRFVNGGGVRCCPNCGDELVLNPDKLWIEGAWCPYCENSIPWERWASLEDVWHWDDHRTGLISFHGDRENMEIPEHCTCIASYAFSNANVISVRVPRKVAVVEPFAFAHNSHLKKVELPEGLQRIEEGTFFGCDGLTQVNIPETVRHIGRNAFSGCTSLKEVHIPESVLLIDEGAFAGSGLTEIALPGTRIVGDNAFSGCAHLRSVTLKATRIGYSAFCGCSNLRKLTLEEGVMNICVWAFHGCTGLKHVRIPASVHELGNQVFAEVRGLTVSMPKQLGGLLECYRAKTRKGWNPSLYLFEKDVKIDYYEGGENNG